MLCAKQLRFRNMRCLAYSHAFGEWKVSNQLVVYWDLFIPCQSLSLHVLPFLYPQQSYKISESGLFSFHMLYSSCMERLRKVLMAPQLVSGGAEIRTRQAAQGLTVPSFSSSHKAQSLQPLLYLQVSYWLFLSCTDWCFLVSFKSKQTHSWVLVTIASGRFLRALQCAVTVFSLLLDYFR